MPIQWNCPCCHKQLSIASRKAGTQIQCPTCNEPLTVPEGPASISEGPPPIPVSKPAPGNERRLHAIVVGLSLLVLAAGGLLLYGMWPSAEDVTQAEATPPRHGTQSVQETPVPVRASPAPEPVSSPAPVVQPKTDLPVDTAPTTAPKTLELIPAPSEITQATEPPPVKPEPTVRRPPPPDQPAVPKPERATRTQEELRETLTRVPEIDLYPSVDKLRNAVLGKKTTGRNLADDARIKITAASTSPPQFSTNVNTMLLKEARAAGLSVQTDARIRVGANAAKTMQHISTTLRTEGFLSTGPTSSVVTRIRGQRVPAPTVSIIDPTTRKIVRLSPAQIEQQSCDRFQKWCDDNRVEKYAGSLPTLVQMLQVENEPLRQVMVRELAKVNSRDAGYFLAKRALFDLSPEVRKSAIEALKKRKPESYRPVFLAAFRYPWAPAADHAAEALVELKDQGAVPALGRLLDQPDPSMATYNETSKTYRTRELVRINHMRNCYLCHAASLLQTDLVRGLVPTPGQPLPRLYYAGQRGDFVRADITYLHQDFSMLDTVPNSDPWPSEQRFDYTTRTRKSTPEEIQAVKDRPADASYPQRDAVRAALRGLTGKDTGAEVVKKGAAPKEPGKGPAEPQGDLAIDLLSRGFDRASP